MGEIEEINLVITLAVVLFAVVIFVLLGFFVWLLLRFNVISIGNKRNLYEVTKAATITILGVVVISVVIALGRGLVHKIF